jgi:uncharacterized OB-fold protein
MTGQETVGGQDLSGLRPLPVTVCPSCQAAYAYYRAVCTRCGTTTEKRELLLAGHVYSAATVHRPSAGFEPWTPYTVALVVCDLGPRVLAMTASTQIDDRVVVGLAALGQANVPFAFPCPPGDLS